STWGENLIVNLGIGAIAFVLSIPGLLAIGLGVASGAAVGVGLGLVLGVIWLIGVSCWASAMTAVFQLTLYRYATQAEIPQEFAQVDLASAFGPKGSERSFGF